MKHKLIIFNIMKTQNHYYLELRNGSPMYPQLNQQKLTVEDIKKWREAKRIPLADIKDVFYDHGIYRTPHGELIEITKGTAQNVAYFSGAEAYRLFLVREVRLGESLFRTDPKIIETGVIGLVMSMRKLFNFIGKCESDNIEHYMHYVSRLHMISECGKDDKIVVTRLENLRPLSDYDWVCQSDSIIPSWEKTKNL